MLLIISYVVYTYKMVLDPFVLMSMAAMDRGVYETFVPIFVTIIIVGFLLHVYLIGRTFKDLKVEKSKKRKKRKAETFCMLLCRFFFRLFPLLVTLLRIIF